MSKKDVHTVPNAGGKGWVNKVGGEVESRHRTKENAVERGRVHRVSTALQFAKRTAASQGKYSVEGRSVPGVGCADSFRDTGGTAMDAAPEKPSSLSGTETGSVSAGQRRSRTRFRSCAAHSVTMTLIGLMTVTVSADVILAKCDSPSGPRVQFGDSYNSGKLQKRILEVQEDGFPGTHPSFIFDTSRPKELIEFFDPMRVPGVPDEIIDRDNPDKIRRYFVTGFSEDQISAVAPAGSAMWAYALYPKLGFLIISRLTHHSPPSELAIGAIYYAKCEVDIRK